MSQNRLRHNTTLYCSLTIAVFILQFAAMTLAKPGLCYLRDTKNSSCSFCYLSKPNYSNGECLDILPNNNNSCRFYIDAFKTPRCQNCREGYYLTPTKDFSSFVCVKDPQYIKGCFQEQKVLNKTCSICQGGFPADKGKKCVAFNQIDTKDLIQHCLYGFRNSLGNACYRCEEGFTYDYIKRECLKTGDGCLAVLRTNGRVICTGCDVYNGYEMQRDLSCKKVGE